MNHTTGRFNNAADRFRIGWRADQQQFFFIMEGFTQPLSATCHNSPNVGFHIDTITARSL